jgi:DNA recombination protein RmuC
MRYPGLAQKLQTKYRVTVAGPSTLHALLNSLQMGFRTLAIQKRSGEVWRVLTDAKTEFNKYADVWDKVSKQLQTAQNTIQEVGVRTRAVERKLRQVEGQGLALEGSPLVELPAPDEGEDEA